MSCPELSVLQAHIEGRATPDEREATADHLETCEACRELVLAIDPPDAPDAPDPREVDADAPDGPDVLAAGERIDRYVTLERLGTGGMGVVYSAYDPELNRKVALKLIRARAVGAPMQERLLREAQAMAQVTHPNVAAVFDVGRHGEQLFVAMELIEGETLASWLARERRSRAEILRVFTGAGRGLQAAHAAGLVHRDFKPSNVMIDGDRDGGRARVLDFGLARAAGAEPGRDAPPAIKLDRITATGVLLGTPAYMAPEQLGRQETDARTDQFSFCVALYEALAGTRPFVAGDTDELQQAIAAQRLQPPQRAVPRWLLRVVERGLRADPAARWPTMDALLSQLAREQRAGRWLALVATMLVVATPVAGYAALSHQEAHRCAVRAGAIDPVWNSARRHAMRDAFLGSDQRNGAALFESTAHSLDDYAQKWRALADGTCRETGLLRAPVEATRRKSSCLDNRLAELRSLVGIFATADAEVVRHARAAVSGQSSLDDCRDAAQLASDPLPADPVVRAEVVTLQNRLAEIRALDLTARYQPALDAAHAIEPRVLAAQHGPTTAQLYLIEGLAAVSNDDFPTAKKRGQKAILLAETAGAGPLVLEGWVLLVHVATEEAKGDDADVAFDHGLAWSTRLDDERARAKLLVYHAESLGDRGRGSDAVAAAREALRLAERGHDPDLTYAATSALAGVLDQAGQLDEAQRYYMRALATLDARNDKSSRMASSVRSNLGTMLLGQGKLPEARAQLEAALAIDEELFGPHHPEVGRTLSLLAYVAQTQGRLDDTERLARRALAIFDERLAANDSLRAFPLIALGKVALARHRPAAAIQPLTQAVTLLAAVDSSPTDLAVARGRLGEALVQMGQAARGWPLIDQARTVLVAHRNSSDVAELDAWVRTQRR